MEMKVQVYKDGQFRQLSGNKIYQNGNWVTLAGKDRIYFNGAWHYLDYSSQSLTFDNGTEPTTGTIWYITPNGSGNMDGSSWENAASDSQISTILSNASEDDNIYMSEGEYTSAISGSVNIYGGFSSVNPTWGTRNGFVHQTIVQTNISAKNVDGIISDGGVINGSSSIRNCIVKDITSTTKNYIFQSYSIVNCAAINCSITKNHSDNSTHRIFIFSGVCRYCMAINCSLSLTCNEQAECYIFNSDSNLFRVENETHNCIAVNCVCTFNSINNNLSSRTSIFGNTQGGHNESHHYNDIAINCSAFYIYNTYSYNCAAVNCSSQYYTFNTYMSMAHFCTAARCSSTMTFHNVRNSTRFNCSGDFYSSGYGTMTNCAVGTANDFTNIGYSTQGRITSLGDCPSPLSNPSGYAAYINAFGDWHPVSNSSLIGAGAYDSNIIIDADGVTRPNPPTIGAYEPRPV